LPALIILDMALKKPSAFAFLNSLKQTDSSKDIPVIMLSKGKSVRSLTKAFDLGAHDYISRPFFSREVIARIRNIRYAEEKMREMESMLVRDPLTGLYNRLFFNERIKEELNGVCRYGEPLSLIIIDIDKFKSVNDTHGHNCGDEILKRVGAAIYKAARSNDVVARYGGEEFVVLLPHTTHQGAITMAERLRANVQFNSFYWQAMKIPVTISLGVNTTDDKAGITPEVFIEQSDLALYKAKKTGRNKVVSALEMMRTTAVAGV